MVTEIIFVNSHALLYDSKCLISMAVVSQLRCSLMSQFGAHRCRFSGCGWILNLLFFPVPCLILLENTCSVYQNINSLLSEYTLQIYLFAEYILYISMNLHLEVHTFYSLTCSENYLFPEYILHISLNIYLLGGVWIQRYRGWDRDREIDERLGLKET
jgi:hypothetical protein